MPIRYTNLGQAGVKVSNFCLGCFNFGSRTDETESVRIIHAAQDAGINFFDTADYYADGRSEEILGKALAGGRRHTAVITTKIYWPTGSGPNDRGSSRYHLLQSLETSLRRLQTDHVDLLLLHAPDPETLIEESLRTLDDLVRAGKVRYFGVSEFPAWQIVEALWASQRRGFEPIICTQQEYSMLYRRPEAEIIPAALRHGLGIMAFGTLAWGLLTGRYQQGQSFPADSRVVAENLPAGNPHFQRDWERANRLAALAREAGLEPAHFALAWLLTRPGVSSVMLGPRTLAQLADSLKAADTVLLPALVAGVDAIVPPRGES